MSSGALEDGSISGVQDVLEREVHGATVVFQV